MIALKSNTLRKLLEAAEILHSHAQGAFHDRVFRASDLLLADTYHAFEVYGVKDGTHSLHTDAPVAEKGYDEWFRRSLEVVPVEHPIFPVMSRGKVETTRLSDLISQRQLRRTNLYNDVFKPTEAKYQIIAPFASGDQICGLTVNRGTKDYSDEELLAANLFTRHLIAAYETDRLLNASAAAMKEAKRFDHEHLRRRGLTRRECEVLWWVAEGKRNAEIGIILEIATVTVEVHLTSVYRKLGVENRMAAVANMSAEG